MNQEEEYDPNIQTLNNFITDEDASILIYEIDNPSEINEYPDFYKNRNGGTALPYNKTVIKVLKKYANLANKIHEDLWNVDKVYTTKAYSSKWLPGQFSEPHFDNVQKEEFVEWSSVIYLNDSLEFEGGILYFPATGLTIHPQKNMLVTFPQLHQDIRYLHGVTEITSGHRYTLIMHHCSNIEFADPDLLENE